MPKLCSLEGISACSTEYRVLIKWQVISLAIKKLMYCGIDVSVQDCRQIYSDYLSADELNCCNARIVMYLSEISRRSADKFCAETLRGNGFRGDLNSVYVQMVFREHVNELLSRREV